MKLRAIPFMLMLSSVLSCAQKNAEMSVADIADEESKGILAKQAAPATSQLAQAPRTDLYRSSQKFQVSRWSEEIRKKSCELRASGCEQSG
jgi:hypothetical protein